MSGIIIMIIAYSPLIIAFRGCPAVGFGPKLVEMNPRTCPDLPICSRTLDVDQNTSKIPPNMSSNKNRKILGITYHCLMLPNNSYPSYVLWGVYSAM